MKTNLFTLFAAMTLFFMTGTQAFAAGADSSPGIEAARFEASDINEQPRYGEDSVQCVRNWSLYAEYYRQRNFKMAVEPWRWMFHNCPLATQNIYIHGAVLVKHLYQAETDPIKRKALVDTLMMVYDQRIEHFGREGYVLGRKVADLYQYDQGNVQEQQEISERSIQLEGNDSQADVLLINFQSTVRLSEAGLVEPTEVVEKYDRAIDIIDYNLIHKPQDSVYYVPAKNNIEILFEPFASCENLVQIFKPRYEANPEDPELLARITDMLEKSGCTESPLFFNATKSLHRLHPTAQSAYLMGRLEGNQENHAEALSYYEEAIALYDADDSENYTEEKFRTYLLMAEISFRNLRRFPQARNYALEASRMKSDDGRPYILIGELYAASANDCGDDAFTKKTAYWAAVDKFIQARNVDSDPQVVDRATQFINTYSQYFPNMEDIFFHGHDEGDPYRVECWINETTRIRPR
ncbi:MAG: tetratricopeptide repeat protein [Bacteroidales bacterium]